MDATTVAAWAAVASAISAFINLLLVIAYTLATGKMQRHVERQADELTRQITLSLKPFFIAQHEVGPSGFWGIKLENSGNGTAINITVKPSGREVNRIYNGPQLLHPRQEPAFIQYIDFNESRTAAVPQKREWPHAVNILFEDIEGREYEQLIEFPQPGAINCVPSVSRRSEFRALQFDCSSQ